MAAVTLHAHRFIVSVNGESGLSHAGIVAIDKQRKKHDTVTHINGTITEETKNFFFFFFLVISYVYVDIR